MSHCMVTGKGVYSFYFLLESISVGPMLSIIRVKRLLGKTGKCRDRQDRHSLLPMEKYFTISRWQGAI